MTQNAHADPDHHQQLTTSRGSPVAHAYHVWSTSARYRNRKLSCSQNDGMTDRRQNERKHNSTSLGGLPSQSYSSVRGLHGLTKETNVSANKQGVIVLNNANKRVKLVLLTSHTAQRLSWSGYTQHCAMYGCLTICARMTGTLS